MEPVDERMAVHFLVAADTDKPGIVTARQFALLDSAEMDMASNREMGAVLMPDRLTLQPVKRRIHRSAFEVVCGVNPADFTVREHEFDSRLPIVHRDLNVRRAHAADDLPAFVPFVVVS